MRKKRKSGVQISTRDSCIKCGIVEIMKEHSQPLRSISLEDKSRLNGKIQGLKHMFELEWIVKNIKQKELFIKIS